MPKRAPIHRLGPKRKPRVYDDRPTANQRGYTYRWQQLRKRILKRDHYLCQECKRKGKLTAVGESGHVDHIVPKRDGGPDEPGNLQTLCASCHSRKTARGL